MNPNRELLSRWITVRTHIQVFAIVFTEMALGTAALLGCLKLSGVDL